MIEIKYTWFMSSILSLLFFVYVANASENLISSSTVRVYLSPGGIIDIRTPLEHSEVIENSGRITCKKIVAKVSAMDSGLELRDVEIKKLLGVDSVITATEIAGTKLNKNKIGSALININKIEKRIPFRFMLMGLNKIKVTFYLDLSEFSIAVPEYLGAKVKDQIRIVSILPFTSIPPKVEVKSKGSKRS